MSMTAVASTTAGASATPTTSSGDTTNCMDRYAQTALTERLWSGTRKGVSNASRADFGSQQSPTAAIRRRLTIFRCGAAHASTSAATSHSTAYDSKTLQRSWIARTANVPSVDPTSAVGMSWIMTTPAVPVLDPVVSVYAGSFVTDATWAWVVSVTPQTCFALQLSTSRPLSGAEAWCTEREIARREKAPPVPEDGGEQCLNPSAPAPFSLNLNLDGAPIQQMIIDANAAMLDQLANSLTRQRSR